MSWSSTTLIGIYLPKVKVWNMFKVNNIDTRTTPIQKFENISHLVLMFLLLTLNMKLLAGYLKTLLFFFRHWTFRHSGIFFSSMKNSLAWFFSFWSNLTMMTLKITVLVQYITTSIKSQWKTRVIQLLDKL